MDEFVGFSFLLVDVGRGRPTGEVVVVERGGRRERVDLIARQFRDFLAKPAPPGGDEHDAPRGFLMTHDFRLRGRAVRAAGWLEFHAVRAPGGGTTEELVEVARLVFARAAGEDAAAAVLRRLGRYADGLTVPAAPFAVAVLVAADVPSVVRDMLPKAAAGFFSDDFDPAAGGG